jgi:hypothetical protein
VALTDALPCRSKPYLSLVTETAHCPKKPHSLPTKGWCYGSNMSGDPKGHHGKGSVCRVAIGRWWHLREVGPSGRPSGHWGMFSKEIVGIPRLSLSQFPGL